MFISNHIEENTRGQRGSTKLRLQWKSMAVTVNKHLKKPDVIYGTIFHIGKDMAKITTQMKNLKWKENACNCGIRTILDRWKNSFINDAEFYENINIQRDGTDQKANAK